MKGIDSANTSRKQVAAGFKKMGHAGLLESGVLNFDVGGGRFDLGTEFLFENFGVKNVIYDPYNRPHWWNEAAIELLEEIPAKTATLFNVLNVIPDRDERLEAVSLALAYSQEGVFITVYEKNRDGRLEYTRDGWQMNQPLSFYMDEINAYLNNACAYKEAGLLVVKNTPSM